MTTRRGICSRSCRTTGCCRSPDRRPGTRSSAGRRATSRRVAKGLTAVQTSTPVRALRRVDRRRRDPHRRRRRRALRRRGGGYASAPGAGAAQRTDTAAARPARRTRLHRQPHRAAHRLVGAAARSARAGVVELRDAVVQRTPDRRAAELQHEPPATTRRDRCRPHLRRHAQRRRPHRSGNRHRPHAIRAPGVHERFGRRPRAAARTQRRCRGLRRRVSGLGIPRGRRALGRRRGSQPGRAAGDSTALRGRHRARARRTGAARRTAPQLPMVRRSGRPATPAARSALAGALRLAPTTSATPRLSLRENIDAYLADNGIDLRGGQITMLANARSVGYVFNPLSLFWCHDPSGQRRVRRRRGAQHVRAAASLPVAHR